MSFAIADVLATVFVMAALFVVAVIVFAIGIALGLIFGRAAIWLFIDMPVLLAGLLLRLMPNRHHPKDRQ